MTGRSAALRGSGRCVDWPVIDEDSVRAVDGSVWRGRFRKPLYGSYCFSRIPGLVRSLLGGEVDEEQRLLLGPLAGHYDAVILLFVDAFGWRSLQRYGDRYPFLARFLRQGRVTKLTSQFPSTTSAHTTCIHSGLEVGQSGIYEWFIYEPSLDGVVTPLLFSHAGERQRNTLFRDGVDPRSLYPRSTFYAELSEMGVTSYIFQSRAFTPSPFADVVCEGAQLRPFHTPVAGLRELCDLALSRSGPSYYFLYNGEIDAAGHIHGPESAQWDEVTGDWLQALEEGLYARLRGRLRHALLLMTADHGMIGIDPERTIYLDRAVPELPGWLQQDRNGRPRWPSGYCRDLFLHLREERLDEAKVRLSEALEGRAEVVKVSDLLSGGLFGQAPPANVFLRRIGNLLVLPDEDQLVWWSDPGYALTPFRGHHGGMSPVEMETELLALPL